MKYLLVLFLLLSHSFDLLAQSGYDSVLAQRYGADDYGMKSYSFVILKTGKIKIADKDSVAKIFRGHLDNINRLVKEEKLIVAGPFEKNEKQYRGLFIFNMKELETVKNILQTDPAVASGLLDYEIFTWYGSAALPAYLEVAEKVTKLKP